MMFLCRNLAQISIICFDGHFLGEPSQFLQARCPFCRPTNSVKALKATEWWGVGMVICLERGADLHTAQLMPQPLTVSCFSKIQLGFAFFGYRLTRVVPEKGSGVGVSG